MSTVRLPTQGDRIEELQQQLAIQPDDAALKAWLGEPVSYLYKHSSAFGGGEFWSHRTTHNGVAALETKALYSPKELKLTSNHPRKRPSSQSQFQSS